MEKSKSNEGPQEQLPQSPQPNFIGVNTLLQEIGRLYIENQMLRTELAELAHKNKDLELASQPKD